jgi:hypothetical protein
MDRRSVSFGDLRGLAQVKSQCPHPCGLSAFERVGAARLCHEHLPHVNASAHQPREPGFSSIVPARQRSFRPSRIRLDAWASEIGSV